jgi:hypothetical protein
MGTRKTDPYSSEFFFYIGDERAISSSCQWLAATKHARLLPSVRKILHHTSGLHAIADKFM